MSTISRKPINLLVKDLLKNPKDLNNYLMGRINVLKKINYLKDIQFDINIDNYTYFKILVDSIWFEENFIDLHDEYREYINKYLDSNNIIMVKTNIYYHDIIRHFYSQLEQPLLTYNGLPNLYCRMVCSLARIKYDNFNDFTEDGNNLETGLTLFNDRIFRLDELLELCSLYGFSIIDNKTEPDYTPSSELEEAFKSGKLFLSVSKINCLNRDFKIVADFGACKNEFDRKMWAVLYESFINYLRYNKIVFSSDLNDKFINLQTEYNDNINHIMSIINGIKSKYKKSGKKVPSNIQSIIVSVLSEIDNLKNEYNYKSNIDKNPILIK